MGHWNNKDETVYYRECDTYDTKAIFSVIESIFDQAASNVFSGKKVVIKPNLLMRSTPDRSITTHPSLVEATARYCLEHGALSVTLCESSGGPFTESWLKPIYNASGMTSAAISSGAALNSNFGYSEIYEESNPVLKVFNIIDPILEADVIISISKLKSHALTMMSGAVKNLFGTIPGIQKFEMHARFPDHTDFANALIDICKTIHQKKELINLCDAVIGLEGNGPSTSGSPRKIGYIAMSKNPFCLDVFNEHMIGFDGKVEMLSIAAERGYTYRKADKLIIDGNGYEEKRILDFKNPDSHGLNMLRHIPKFMEPYPKVNAKECRGCGECAKSCPEKGIEIKNKIAVISHDKCIRCFCCQELCPFHAVKIHEIFIYKAIKGIEKKLWKK